MYVTMRTLIDLIQIACILRIAEGAVRRRRGRSTGRDGQSENVKRLDRKSQAQMAESVQELEDQLAHHAAAVRQVREPLISYPTIANFHVHAAKTPGKFPTRRR